MLKYRLAREKGSTYSVEKDALGDMQQAIRLVKSRAAEWNVDPDRVGVIGFSAGGQLALMAAQGYQTAEPSHRGEAAMTGAPATGGDAVDQQSDGPAFEVLMYPGG